MSSGLWAILSILTLGAGGMYAIFRMGKTAQQRDQLKQDVDATKESAGTLDKLQNTPRADRHDGDDFLRG